MDNRKREIQVDILKKKNDPVGRVKCDARQSREKIWSVSFSD